MTGKEARLIMETFLKGCNAPHDGPCIQGDDAEEVEKYVCILDAALDQRTPRKVREDVVTLAQFEYKGKVYLCPSCLHLYPKKENDKYCRECGQALDWSDCNA